MPLKRPPLWRLALVLLAVVPALAWAVVKPVRILAPELNGVTCVRASVCLDDVAKTAEAESLYSDALNFVSERVARPDGPPRVIFCASQACAEHFGLGARSAITLGTAGTVIGPRAWKPFYVRHELIHHAQAERLGVLKLFGKPQWFIEGMAYGLSEDPRSPLVEPFEGYRREFFAWYKSVETEKLWAEAAKL